MSGGWFDEEAIAEERFAADLEMAAFEEEGRRYAAAGRKAKLLYFAGDLAGAAKACPHGGGYPLDSPAAVNNGDPFAGEAGVRCHDCGSRLSDFAWDGGTVLVPCELGHVAFAPVTS